MSITHVPKGSTFPYKMDELIRKLTECDPDREVRFRFDAYFYGSPKHFDEYIDFYDIENNSYSNEAVFKLTF